MGRVPRARVRWGPRSRSGSPPTRARRHGVLMANGTVTMEVALKALGIGWGDEVIVPALTFSATAYAPIAAGALPVFVDVTPETWTIDPAAVEAAITDRTRAIMPVHLGHQMADMDRIMEIATTRGLAVVEDCAHAPGQRWRDRGAGCIGDFGSFSHQSSKILTAGEGGSAADERRPARAARALDHRLRPPEGRRRARVHLRGELPARRAPRRPAAHRDGPVPRRTGQPRGARRRLRGAGARGPGRARDAARRPHHAVELLSLRPGDRPRGVRRADARGRVRRPRGRGRSAPGPATSRCRATTCSSPRCRGCPCASSTPTGSTPRRCRSPSPRRRGSGSRSTSTRTSSAPTVPAWSRRWRRWRRSSATPRSCRRLAVGEEPGQVRAVRLEERVEHAGR